MTPLSLLLGLAVLLAYLFCAGPTFYWLDSSELTAAAWGLGNAHPPGHPLASLLSRLVCLLPVGTISFRVTLASALAAAGATTLTAVLCGQVVARLRSGEDGDAPRGPAWIVPAAISAAALTVGLSYSLWFQAVRTEVYALNLLMLLAGACLVLRWDRTGDRRWLLAAALACGLALCNHHFLVILAIPGVGLFVLLRRPRPGWRRLTVGVVLAGTLGLTCLAYLPLRARTAPEVNWGSPSTAERFYWVVSAKAFQKAVDKAAKETLSHRGGGAMFAVVDGLGPLAAVMALGGLYFLWRRRQSRKVGLLLTLLVGGNLLSPLTVGFDPLNADAHGYLAVAVAFLAPGMAVFVVVLARATAARSRAAPALICSLAAGVALYQGASTLPRADLRGHWAAEETARQVLDQPHGSLLLTSYFETVFNAWAMRAVADHRPDLGLLHRGFVGMPGYAEDQRRRLPVVSNMITGWRRTGRLDLADLDQLVGKAPLRVEFDLNVPRALANRLAPAGLALAYQTQSVEHPPPSARALSEHRYRFDRWHGILGPIRDLETRRTLTWTHYLLTWYACSQGHRALARYHHGRARQLSPRSVHLAELAKGCGLGR